MKFYPLQNVSDVINTPKKLDMVSSLFEKTSKMSLLQREFTKVLLMSKKKREKWVMENQDFIQQLLFTFRQETSLTLNDVIYSEQGKEQVTEYIVVLQQTLSTLERIVFDGEDSKD